jgi:hypothetical protein
LNTIVWVHGDALRIDSAAFRHTPGAPAIFVWDDVVIRGYGLSLKRLVFMYECLLDLPLDIYRGDVATEVRGFAQRHAADTIVTMESVAPRFHHIVTELRQTHTVLVLADAPLVEAPAGVDLGRFSRYWQKIRPLLLKEAKQVRLFDDL